MITSVSASENNITDTVSATDNLEVSASENNNYEVDVAALPNTNSENVNNNNEINNEEINETSSINNELNVLDENPTSNFELEKLNNVRVSVQNELLLSKDILTSSSDNHILGVTPQTILTANGQYSEITNYVWIANSNVYVKFSLTSIDGDYYTYTWSVYSDPSNFRGDEMYLFEKKDDWSSAVYITLSTFLDGDTESKTVNSATVMNTDYYLAIFRAGYGTQYSSSKFYLPRILEPDTTVSITNPSVKYNSGTFNVSGTETGMIIC